jgi:Ca2+-binding EF-hand superfamily protein
MFDRSGTGTINRNDLKAVLGKSDQAGIGAQIEEIIKQIDTHSSGDIDYNEFKVMMKGNEF